ncbi:MAG: hypothetical protein HZB83_07280 [Deltaproteobacteria bacterium]|nr:hypothetical protein [Deltaproteobacteria bacterium]
MGFWNNVNDELKKAVEEGWTAVKEGAKIGKMRLQIYSLHKKAEGLFAEIGGTVYDMAKPPYENPLSRPEVLRLIEEINPGRSNMNVLNQATPSKWKTYPY